MKTNLCLASLVSRFCFYLACIPPNLWSGTLAESLNTPDWTWATGGDQAWNAQTTNTHDGAEAAASGRLTARNQTSWVETTVTGPGAIAFWWRISAYPDSVNLRFKVDDSTWRSISGEQFWKLECLALSEGTRTLRWEYARDSSINRGANLAWLDEVRLLTSSPPVILVEPASQTIQGGMAVVLSVQAVGYPWPPAYQWRKDGVDLAGQTTDQLLLGNVTSSQAGVYSVIVANNLGSVESAKATLIVLPGITLGEALDAPNLAWTTRGTAGWFWQTNTHKTGTAAARSGAIGDDQASALETTVTGPGAIGFWWKVSSQSFDSLEFLLNNSRKLSINGEVDWEFKTVDVAAGNHTLTWQYGKRSSGTAGSDCGWVDGVVFVTNSPPVILTQPASSPVIEGETIRLSVFAFGVPPLRYEWFMNGVPVAGQTNAALALSGANPSMAGAYSVRVANDYGITASSNEQVTVLPMPTLAEAVNDADRVWLTGGGANWFAQGANTHDGIAAAQSGDIGDNQSSWIETTLAGPGTVTFWWRTDCQSGFDRLRFLVDGAQVMWIAGVGAWTQVTHAVPSGLRTLRWSFEKDSSTSSGADCGWLDEFSFTPAPPPVITVQPASLTNVVSGSWVSFHVGVASQGDVACQWQRNGAALPGATNLTLVLTSVTTNDAGLYTAVVGNLSGSVTSSIASLTVLPPLPENKAAIEAVDLFGGLPSGLLVRGNHVYWGQTSSLGIYDATDRTQLIEVGRIPFGTSVLALGTRSNHLYAVLNSGQFVIMDITNPIQPVVQGQCLLQNWRMGGSATLAIAGDYVYVAAGSLTVVNVLDPFAPQVARVLNLNAEGVFTTEGRLYVVGANLQILDLIDPANPIPLGFANQTGERLVVQDGLAIVGGWDGLCILSVTNPANITVLATHMTDGAINGLALWGNTLVLAGNGMGTNSPALRLLSLANPAQPAVVGSLVFPSSEAILELAVNGSTAFLSQMYGLRTVDLGNSNASPPVDPNIVGALPNPSIVNQVLVDGARLYLLTQLGPWIYSLEDPAKPVLLRAYTNAPGLLRMCLMGNRLYGAFGPLNTNVVILDVTQPETMRELGRYASSRWTKDIVASGDHVFLLSAGGPNSWMELVNTTDPVNPAKLGEWPVPGQGRVLCVADNRIYVGWTNTTRGGLSIVDLSNPASPVELGQTAVANLPTAIAVSGTRVFVGSCTTNQVWNIEVFDITDPTAIRRVATSEGGGNLWGLALLENLVFAAVEGQSTMLWDYSYDTDQFLAGTICHSPGSLEIALLTPDANGYGYNYTAEGFGIINNQSRYGKKGVAIQRFRPMTVSESPMLTLGGGKFPVVLHPYHRRLTNGEEVLTFSLTANQAADWLAVSATFDAFGNPGNELGDLEIVTLKRGQDVLSSGTYSADNGSITLAMNQRIPASSTLIFDLVYRFKPSEFERGPLPRFFGAQLLMAKVNAQPINPPVPQFIKQPDTPIIGGPVKIAPVWNVQTELAYDTIQAAIDDPLTRDGHTLMASCITYIENVRVTKSLAIEGVLCPGTFDLITPVVLPPDVDLPGFDLQVSGVRIKNFLISGAANSAGVWANGFFALESNFMSLNRWGVYVASGNGGVISGNHVANNLTDGIYITNATALVLCQNEVWRNGGDGIELAGINTHGNLVVSNLIGKVALDFMGYSQGNGEHGLLLNNSPANQIGAAALAAGNVFAGNGGAGLALIGPGAHWNVIATNLFGINRDGNYGRSNRWGLLLKSAVSNTIVGNVISGNNQEGVRLEDSRLNTLALNKIGTDFNGASALGNGGSGIFLIDSSHNTIGGSQAQNGNLISGNLGHGVEIQGELSSSNKVFGNRIGTDIAGQQRVSNWKDGICLDGAPDNIFSLNLVSGNTGAGILIEGTNATRNYLSQNSIGIAADGQSPLGNGYPGIYIWDSQGNWIGPSNVISGNDSGGISIYGSRNEVYGNLIGTDAAGLRAVPNNGHGIFIKNPGQDGNKIGGGEAQERNVISGNTHDGVFLYQATGNRIENNLIGTDRLGTGSLGNQRNGVDLLESSNNWIGGIQAGSGNVIGSSPAPYAGILLSGSCSNFIGNNLVGVDLNAILPMPNGGPGLYLTNSSGNTIGTDGRGWNVFAYNEDGIRIASGTNNAILYNSIDFNRNLGINLDGNDQPSGITPNDELDPDTGPNLLQNYPVLDAVQSGNGRTIIKGTMPGRVFSRYLLQFFASNNPDDTGFGEGARWQADRWVGTDMIGLRPFMVVLNTPVPVGHYLTATATDESKNTSEFSRAVQVQPGEDRDADGVNDLVENSAPNTGDANRDGIPDQDQKYVASLPADTERFEYVSLATSSSQEIRNAHATSNPQPANTPTGAEFPLGFISFEIHKVSASQPTRIELALPQGTRANAFWKFGPTPDNPEPHWYRFVFDGAQGAVFENGKCILFILDGRLGDDDLNVNAAILGLGGPAYEAEMRFRNIRRLADGRVRFELAGQAGQEYSIEISLDLSSWNELLRTNAPTDVLEITDTQALSQIRRFYRAVQIGAKQN